MPLDRRDALKAFGLAPLALAAPALAAPDKTAADAEAERVRVIAAVQPAVAAVCFYNGTVCGSGVVISEDGYCLTNYHVTSAPGMGMVFGCGLADGKLYEAVLVGQDRVGDVALVKLLPKKPGDKFPFVKLGDSDKLEAGQWSLAMGNPFGLALDFTPTVTFGLISGVNRYQPPEGKGTLEYTDCIQFDTSINPGNSGGPLFNMQGELVGINGRGSFEKRGRVNSGVGYAISINQIKNFLGHMRAGIDTDHATLGAGVATAGEESGSVLNKMVFTQLLDESDAARRGIRSQDELVAFAGRPMNSTNQYKNVLGIYPSGWRLPLRYKAGGQGATKETLVRLLANMDKEVEPADGQPGSPPPKQPGPQPNPQPGPQPNPGGRAAKSAANKMVELKKGYANFYFNRQETARLLEAFKKAHGDGTAFTGNWKADGEVKLADGRGGELKLEWADDKDGFTEVKLARGNIAPDGVKPLAPDITPADRFLPQGSGGLLVALFQYKLFVSKLNGAGGFKSNDSTNPGFTHAGVEPVYPVADDMKLKQGEDLLKSRIDCEVIRTVVDNYSTKWFFHPKDATLVGWETSFTKDEDPCEVYAYDHKDAGGVKLPHKLVVRWGDKVYATLTVKSYTLGKK